MTLRGPRFFLNKTILFTVLCLFSLVLQAQPPTQVPKEVIPGQVDPKNLSPTQLSTLLGDKNRETGKDKNQTYVNSNRVDKDSTGEDNIKKNNYSPDKTFGADAFSYAASTDLSELSTPPLDYPIGVGDFIIVAMWGAAEFQTDYLVARDGAIFPQGLGKINVAGLTFETVRQVVYSRFKSVVPAGTNISITLGTPRSISVNVVGEVNQPGPVTVSAFSNAYNVIARAGGVSEFANLRSIKIKRSGRVIDDLDVYTYLTTGDFGKHIYLSNNDFIIVGVVEKKVLATGQFKRPMFYQLKEEEGVKALLKYSGGLTPDALASGMKIIRSEDEKQKQRDVNANAIMKINSEDYKLEDGDIVRVDLIKAGIINKVEVRGEVTYPDFYEIRPGDRLFDIINRAGGVTRNTLLSKAYIFRGAADSTRLQSDRLEVSLSEVMENISSVNNVELLPNDQIQLFSTGEFGDAQFVEIFGEVRKEGRVRKYGGMTLQDLLYLSGGLKQSAEFGRLEIASIVDIDSARQGLKPTRTVVRSYAIQSNLELDSASGKVLLKPYDQVQVRKNPTFEFQQNIQMSGLFRYPGLYPRLNQFERLSSYIDRAGGFKENANLSGAVLYRLKPLDKADRIVVTRELDSSIKAQNRNKELAIRKMNNKNFVNNDGDTSQVAKKMELEIEPEKPIDDTVSIDMYRALKYRNSKYDIVLREKDIIYIPEINPFVSVQGSVQSPLKIIFDKEHTNLTHYIDKAGGFGIDPWRKRVYVKYANGRSKRTRNFLLFHFYPKVEEGATVYVPVKPATQSIVDVAKSIVVGLIPIAITAAILKLTN